MTATWMFPPEVHSRKLTVCTPAHHGVGCVIEDRAMNVTGVLPENVMELLVYTPTRYQVLLSDFFKHLGTRLECVCVSVCEFVNCSLQSYYTLVYHVWEVRYVSVCVSVCVCQLGLEQVGNFPCQLTG